MVNAVLAALVIVGTVSVPVSVGEADNTVLPVPVLVVTPVPPLVTAKTPDELTPSAKMDKLRDMVIRWASSYA